jgi:hypothetical protein
MRKILLLVFSLVILSSCAQLTWYKGTARPGEFEQDKYTCTQQSQQQYGVAQVDAYGGAAVNKVITNNNLFTQCMNAKGWSLQRQDNAQALVQQQQNDQAQRNAEIKKAFDDYRELVKANCAKPEFSEYNAKTSCLAGDITFAQLADDTKITKEQKAILPKQRESIDELHKLYFELQVKYFGDVGRRMVDLTKTFLEPKEQVNNLDLYNGKITWGQYNTNRKATFTEFQTKLKEIK